MRQIAIPATCFLGLVAAAATASSLSRDGTPWDLGARYNVATPDDGSLILETSRPVSLGWRRHPTGSERWIAQADAGSGGWFGSADRCLPILDGGSTGVIVVGEIEHQTSAIGLGGGEVLATLPSGQLLPLPGTLSYVPELRFLTAGAHGGSSYGGREAAYTGVCHDHTGAAFTGFDYDPLTVARPAAGRIWTLWRSIRSAGSLQARPRATPALRFGANRWTGSGKANVTVR